MRIRPKPRLRTYWVITHPAEDGKTQLRLIWGFEG